MAGSIAHGMPLSTPGAVYDRPVAGHLDDVVEERGRQRGEPLVERPPDRVGEGGADGRRHVEVGAQPRERLAHDRPAVQGDGAGAAADDHEGEQRRPVAVLRDEPRRRRRRATRRATPAPRTRSAVGPPTAARGRAAGSAPRAGSHASRRPSAEHVQLGEVGGGPDRAADAAAPPADSRCRAHFRPLEQHVGAPRPRGGREPGEDEPVAVHRDRGLQIDAAEAVLPPAEDVEPLGRACCRAQPRGAPPARVRTRDARTWWARRRTSIDAPAARAPHASCAGPLGARATARTTCAAPRPRCAGDGPRGRRRPPPPRPRAGCGRAPVRR